MRIRNKNIKITVLLFLPVYFLFLSVSLRSYHSHIFANGIIITHSQTDCDHKKADSGSEKSDEQIIIFHGLMQDFPDEVEPVVLINCDDFYWTKIKLPPENTKDSGFSERKMGRAPPFTVQL